MAAREGEMTGPNAGSATVGVASGLMMLYGGTSSFMNNYGLTDTKAGIFSDSYRLGLWGRGFDSEMNTDVAFYCYVDDWGDTSRSTIAWYPECYAVNACRGFYILATILIVVGGVFALFAEFYSPRITKRTTSILLGVGGFCALVVIAVWAGVVQSETTDRLKGQGFAVDESLGMSLALVVAGMLGSWATAVLVHRMPDGPASLGQLLAHHGRGNKVGPSNGAPRHGQQGRA